MRTRLPSLPSYGTGWSANRRVATVAIVVTLLIAVAAVVAWLTGSEDGRQDRTAAPPSHSPTILPAAPTATVGPGSVPAPPQISEPVAYARAAAEMLWSYDTRTTSRDQQLVGMRAWMTTDGTYADWTSASGQVPGPVLWSRMADQDQHATGSVVDGHYPTAFKDALADDPSAITKAYVYVVTVNGKQEISWKGGGSGAEERAVTLAVQCRPGHDCALAAIAPGVIQ
ncbi:hypothetical protein [Streptomyces sp. NPDC092952]|uniref:hypothetical protein n=1 Tax=Streptomyces sp. NPDC092952 TaxID=3366018 RepID=UPI0037FA5988